MQPETTARRRARTSGIMRSAQRTFIFLGAIVFFVLGIAAGLYARDSWSSPTPDLAAGPDPTPTPAAAAQVVPTSAPVEQKSFLIVLVDSRSAAQPILEGVWLVTFDHGSTDYFLLGFDGEQEVGAERRLVDVFNYASTQNDWGTRLTLMDYAVRSINGNKPIAFTIMLDREALKYAIDAVGGIELDGEWLDGTTFLARNGTLATTSAVMNIELQQKVIQAIFTSLNKRAWQVADVNALYNAHKDQYALPTDLLVFALEAMPFTDKSFIVRLSPR